MVTVSKAPGESFTMPFGTDGTLLITAVGKGAAGTVLGGGGGGALATKSLVRVAAGTVFAVTYTGGVDVSVHEGSTLRVKAAGAVGTVGGAAASCVGDFASSGGNGATGLTYGGGGGRGTLQGDGEDGDAGSPGSGDGGEPNGGDAMGDVGQAGGEPGGGGGFGSLGNGAGGAGAVDFEYTEIPRTTIATLDLIPAILEAIKADASMMALLPGGVSRAPVRTPVFEYATISDIPGNGETTYGSHALGDVTVTFNVWTNRGGERAASVGNALFMFLKANRLAEWMGGAVTNVNIVTPPMLQQQVGKDPDGRYVTRCTLALRYSMEFF
jgi:hypothetical protein